MQEQQCDIAIVGAGFAGLSAARTLVKSGLNVCVVEARERVGGRVYTVKTKSGLWVDLGGQWIGPTQERIIQLIRECGLRTFKTYMSGSNLVLVDGSKRRYRGTIPWVGVRNLLSVGVTQWQLDRMAQHVPLQTPWTAEKAHEWDNQTLSDYLDQHIKQPTARKLFEAGLETVYAAKASEISLLHALFYIHSGKNLDTLFGTIGAAQDSRVDGGMQLVAERMCDGLNVILQQPVQKISHDENQVKVYTADHLLVAKRVIVAVPPKLTSKIVFDPEISGGREQLVQRMPHGAVIKCTCVYDRPFWRTDGLSGHSLSDEGPIHITFDNSPREGTPGVLMGFAEADNARKLGALPIEERKAIVLKTLAQRFGERALNPVDYLDHVWEHDPFSLGCYGAFMPPGVWTTLGPSMRKPVGRVHWAGTETAAVWAGYIDGAIESGVRVAEEILRLG